MLEEENVEHVRANVAATTKAFKKLFANPSEAGVCQKVPRVVMDMMDPEKQHLVTHLAYVQCLSSGFLLDQLLTQMLQRCPTQIQHYGQAKFVRLLSRCEDRKLLAKLVNKEISFDQFVARVNSGRGAQQYKCKDDLL